MRSLDGLLDQLDHAFVEVTSLSIHLSDLDDVFHARTGQPDREKDHRAMTTLTFAVRDSSTMLRRNLLHMRRYLSLTLMLIGTVIGPYHNKLDRASLGAGGEGL